MKLTPNHRHVAVKQAVKDKKAPTNPLENALYRHLNGDRTTVLDEAVLYAHDAYSHTYKREVLESFLLVEASPAEIQSVTKVPVAVVEAYAHLFFDPSAFCDELDRIEYAYTYTKNDYGADLKRKAVDYGKEFLKVRLSRSSSDIAPSAVMVQNEIRATAYMLSACAKTSAIDSDVSKEARAWAQLALKASENQEEELAVAGVEEIMIALEVKDETTNVEKSGLRPEDIIH